MGIPDPGREQPKNPLERIAEAPQSQEAPELKPLLISFARYNEKECGLNELEPKRAKKSLRVIKDVGTQIKNLADFSGKLPKLEVKTIKPVGDYTKLYKGLIDLPDVEIHEAKTDADKGRLFFFMIENIFYVVAMRDAHYNTH